MPGNSWAAGCKAIEESVKKEHFLPSRYMIKQRGGDGVKRCRISQPVCRRCGSCAVAFGLGLTLSCFCPNGLVLFLAAVIIVAMGFTLAHR